MPSLQYIFYRISLYEQETRDEIAWMRKKLNNTICQVNPEYKATLETIWDNFMEDIPGFILLGEHLEKECQRKMNSLDVQANPERMERLVYFKKLYHDVTTFIKSIVYTNS